MPSTADPREPAPGNDAESSAWSDEGLDSFRPDGGTPPRPSSSGREGEGAPDTDPLAAFKATASRARRTHARQAVRVEKTGRTPMTAAHVGIGLLSVTGVIASVLSVFLPHRPIESLDRRSAASVADPGAYPEAGGRRDIDGVPPQPPQAALSSPPTRVLSSATRQQEAMSVRREPPRPQVDGVPSATTLAAAPMDAWPAFSDAPTPATLAPAESGESAASGTASAADEAALDRGAIEQLLRTYQDAHDRRDATALAAVWPSLDVANLTRAFESVKAQSLTFRTCTTTLQGDHAVAQCPGEIRYVRQVGGDAPQSRRATWTIRLARTDQLWLVQDVVVR